jgi:hypothetical protein
MLEGRFGTAVENEARAHVAMSVGTPSNAMVAQRVAEMTGAYVPPQSQQPAGSDNPVAVIGIAAFVIVVCLVAAFVSSLSGAAAMQWTFGLIAVMVGFGVYFAITVRKKLKQSAAVVATGQTTSRAPVDLGGQKEKAQLANIRKMFVPGLLLSMALFITLCVSGGVPPIDMWLPCLLIFVVLAGLFAAILSWLGSFWRLLRYGKDAPL